jgi:hypothetical protein
MAFSLGGIIKGGLGLVGGALAAGPVGAAIGAIKTLGDVVKGGGTLGAAIHKPILPLPGVPSIIGSSGEASMPVGGGTLGGSAPVLPALPSLPAASSPGTAIVRSSDVRGAVPSQYSTTAHQGQMGHYSRTGRFIRTNARGKAIRRMNPMNVHAARRAIRRIHSGEKLLRKIFSVSHPGHGHTKVKPKFGRKR